jgi:alpha-galactosidase
MASLGYSGNFKVDFEVDYLNNLRIIAGINNYASNVKLASNQEFTTPKLIYTLSTKGKGTASRNLHNWARKYQLLDGNGERLTLLNNWEATYFDFNEQKLKGLLQDTKKLGVDLFLLDDGWFGNKYPRNSDHSSLGDWQPNRTKLPNGIATLVEEATKQGVKFGIWVEPEMVSPKSELYEQHPDWVVKQPQREEHYFRNQLILDLTNPKVQDFVFQILDDLFTKNPALAYIKWDCNAVIYNAHSAFLKDQGAFYVSYVEGLYKVLERIRSKYPKVPMMLCSGGGGRVDYAALRYFTEFWPSDNTDPLERIFMQYEYSYFFPAISTSNHVTDWGKQSLKFRTDVAMMGKLGFDIVVSHLKEQDLLFCQQAVKNYDALKGTIWHGEQYRLADPREGDFAALSYVNSQKTEAVIFNYLVNNRYGIGTTDPVRLKGLDAQKQYRVEEINLYPGTKSSLGQGQTYSGDYLMKVGVNPDLNSNRPSVLLKISAL